VRAWFGEARHQPRTPSHPATVSWMGGRVGVQGRVPIHVAQGRGRSPAGAGHGHAPFGTCPKRSGLPAHDRVIPRGLNLLYMVGMRPILLLAPLALTLLPGQPLGPSPARAQFAGPQAQNPASRPPPPALPGLAARRAPEPIPADPNANLSPTAALFDAINRGDMAAARDAMNRGASLEERNVLGLTAIDAAVDQGRNDILFYLLSARGTTRSAPPPPEAVLTPGQRAARDRAALAEAAAAARAARADRGVVRGQPVATRPRLFGNDGGTPQPQAGFLGFDAGRGAATEPVRGGRRG